MTTPATPATPAIKIVIASGQEFSVPAETDNEAIRQQLQSNGFADVASATIQKSTRTVAGVEVETVEFVKKAGTKGMTGSDVAALIAGVPVLPSEQQQHDPLEGRRLIQKVMAGQLTIDQALTAEPDVFDALARLAMPDVNRGEGERLCLRLQLSPAAGGDVSGW